MKKYNELGSKDRANYWALMHLIDIASLHKENKEISFPPKSESQSAESVPFWDGQSKIKFPKSLLN